MDPTEHRGEGSTAAPVDAALKFERSTLDELRPLVRFLYTHNPFYIASAALVFSGLRVSFDASGETFATTALMIGLTGYTLLLAVTALVLIRKGQVWQDARSLLVLIVLMFLAIPVTFDDTLAANPSRGAVYYLLGLAFSVAVSEALLRGLRIKLPALYRVPYYLLLSLFYIYPLAISPLVAQPNSPTTHWALFGFSPAAAVAIMSLWPAVRRGSAYTAGNGTPWPWPLFPWTLFTVLGFGIAARSFYLCVSLHFVLGSGTIFGWYFLIPLLLAVNVLLLEMAIVGRNSVLRQFTLLAPLALVYLAMYDHARDFVYSGFLALFANALGAAPPLVALVMATLFYTWALVRRVPNAGVALAVALVGFSVIGRETLDIATLVAWQSQPLLVAGTIFAAVALARNASWPAVLAAGCFIQALSLEAIWFREYLLYCPLYFALLSSLLIGLLFRDEFSRVVRNCGAGILVILAALLVWENPQLIGPLPHQLALFGPLELAAIGFGYRLLVPNRLYKPAAIACIAIWALVHGWQVYLHLRLIIPGLDQLTWGAAFFLLAAWISLIKAGLIARPPLERLWRNSSSAHERAAASHFRTG